MAYVAYFKDEQGVVRKFPLDTGGGVVVNSVYSENRANDIAIGTAFDVPKYELGNNSLQVFINGLLCVKDTHYLEKTTSTITFTSIIPKDATITAVVTTSSGAGALATTVATSDSRTSDLPVGSTYTTPTYTLGSDLVKVYLDGLLALQGVQYQELTSKSIKFLTAIPKNVQIVVVASVAS